MSRINDDLIVDGLLRPELFQAPAGSITNDAIAEDTIERSKMLQEATKRYVLPWDRVFVWDAATFTHLPSAASSDDLGMAAGTFATNDRIVKSSNYASSSGTQYLRFEFVVPPEYDEGETLQISLSAKMQSAASSTATIDVECYKCDGAGAVGSDLCSTAAQSINSTTLADKIFEISAGSIVVGDRLDIRVAIAVNDTGGSNVIAWLTEIAALLDIKG